MTLARLLTRSIDVRAPNARPVRDDEVRRGWAAYKRQKRRNLTARGYRVYSTSTFDHWIRVVVPERRFVRRPRLWANVKFYLEPSEFGIAGGRISKLGIETVSEIGVDGFGPVETLFYFERGLDVDRLEGNQRAMTLYADVLRELN